MKALALVVLFFVGVRLFGAAAPVPQAPVASRELADRVLQRGLKEIDLGLYPGSLLMQAAAENAVVTADPATLERTTDILQKFDRKEIKGRGSFLSYGVGGTGAAYLVAKGASPQLAEQVARGARQMLTEQKRSSEGLLVPMATSGETDRVFIDMAFAVTPFLLYAGLHEQRDEYVELAVRETMDLVRILHDPATGLVHQGRGFQGRGVISQDNWSRGNGWAAVGLATLVRDLPAAHPQRPNVERVARDFFAAVLRTQNPEGLWFQEMTDPTSFVEISGSALLLYGLGVALERGLVSPETRGSIVRGLSSLTLYIGRDGSVSHACIGCLCPGEGTKDDYKVHRWAHNDPHGFGPVVMAFTQAVRLGINEVIPPGPPGVFAVPEDSPTDPRTALRIDPDRGQNVSWENDRIAFRVYGPSVRNRVGSGVDVWVKSVPYPVMDRWYRLTDAGYEYHIDRGEGCDFYDVGRARGCGGLAIWSNGKPVVSETYATARTLANTPDAIEVALTFDPWKVGERTVSEERIIRMVKGTNFFRVTSTIRSATPEPITVALGLSTFGHAQLATEAAAGRLSNWEVIQPAHGALGTAVVADPRQVSGFAALDKEQFILVNVRPNEPFTYFIGAAWQGNRQFKTIERWRAYLENEGTWDRLNLLYAARPSIPHVN